MAQYEAVNADYAERKKAAAAKLELEKEPAEKARLTALAEGPAPDGVNQARFAAAVLHYENGQFEKVHDLFAEVADSVPAARAVDARLYQGCCEVQLRQFAQAIKTLTPLRGADTLEGRKR